MQRKKQKKGRQELNQQKRIKQHIGKFEHMKLERINSVAGFTDNELNIIKDDVKTSKKDEHIKVVVRFRPANKGEKQFERDNNINQNAYEPEIIHDSQVSTVKVEDLKTKKRITKTFDYIFPSNTKQKDVFKKVGIPMIKNCLDGFNSTIFAYGQTGSGKTYSMFGQLYIHKEWGIVPSCIQYLFQKLNTNLAENGGHVHMYKVSMQTLQIYRDQLLDLLNPDNKQSLQIKCDFRTDNIFVQGLKSTLISSVKEALGILVEAESNRIVASHKLNSTSSRSHMLVMISVEQVMSDGSVKSSKLNFGDLAGSEDITKALGHKADPELLKQAIGINKSLSALTTTIKYLAENKRPSYRSSPLTHVLKDSLGGNSKTVMFIACSPHYYNRNETIRTLRFATQAKKVKTHAKQNKEQSRKKLLARIKELELLNKKLKMEIDLERQKNDKLQTKIQLNEMATPSLSRVNSIKKPQLANQNSISNTAVTIKITNIDESETKDTTLNDDHIYIPDDEPMTDAESDVPTPKHIRDITRIVTNDLGKINSFLGQMDTLDRTISTGLNENEQLKEEIKRKEAELDDFSNKLNQVTFERNDMENENTKLAKENKKLLALIDQYKIKYPDFEPENNTDAASKTTGDDTDNKYDNITVPKNKISQHSLSKTGSIMSSQSFDDPFNGNTAEQRELTNFLKDMKKKVEGQYKEMVRNNSMLQTMQAQQQMFSGMFGYYNPNLHYNQQSNTPSMASGIGGMNNVGLGPMSSMGSLGGLSNYNPSQYGYHHQQQNTAQSMPPTLPTITSNDTPHSIHSYMTHSNTVPLRDGTMVLNNNYPLIPSPRSDNRSSKSTRKSKKHRHISQNTNDSNTTDEDMDIDNNSNHTKSSDDDGDSRYNSSSQSSDDDYRRKKKRKYKNKKHKKRKKDRYLKKIELLERQVKLMTRDRKDESGKSCWVKWFG